MKTRGIKRYLIWFLATFLVVQTCFFGLDFDIKKVKAEGSGTAEDPYVVYTLTDLQNIKNDLTAHYILANDIDASPTATWNEDPENPGTYFGFEPIGTLDNRFTGSLDGQEHKVINLFINRGNMFYVGLIGYLGAGGITGNIKLEGSDITGDWRVGSLIGASSGTVSNSSSTTGTVAGGITDSEEIGGLVGTNYGTIYNSHSTVFVNAPNTGYVGGLVGDQYGAVSNSYSTGSVIGKYSVGGLVGCNEGGTLSNSYSTGGVTGIPPGEGVVSHDVGGLVGWNMGGLVSKSYSIGLVSSDGCFNIGGFVGFNTGTVSDSFWDTETSGLPESAGGTGKTTVEMKDIATFTDTDTIGLTSAWDFINNPNDDVARYDIWDILPDFNDGYPFNGPSAEYTPTVTTFDATNITQTSVTLNGSIDDIGTADVTVRGFNWGTDLGYGNTTIPSMMESPPFLVGSFANNIESLSCGTTYHYRTYATNSVGIDYGEDVEFVTSACDLPPAEPAEGEFNSPTGIDTDSFGNYYVVDTGNTRVQKFDADSNFLLQWGSVGSGESQFIFPYGLAVDSNNNVYVSDFGASNRVQKFNSAGDFISQWGQLIFTMPPYGIDIGTDNNVYVIDGGGPAGSDQAFKFDIDGELIISWGSTGSEEGQFRSPEGIAVDSLGNIYVSDTGNHRIQKFDSDGTFLAQWGEVGSGTGQFDMPKGIEVDANNDIYVADFANSRIQKFDSSGSYITGWSTVEPSDEIISAPYDIAFGVSGDIFVTDYNNNCVKTYNFSPAPEPDSTPNPGGHRTPTPTPTPTPSPSESPAEEQAIEEVGEDTGLDEFVSDWLNDVFSDTAEASEEFVFELSILENEGDLSGTFLSENSTPIFYTQQPLFSGTTVPNATIELQIQSKLIQATVKSDANGKWSYKLLEPLENGIHTIKITVKDAEQKVLGTKEYKFEIAKAQEKPTPKTNATTEETKSYTWLWIAGIVILGGIISIIFIRRKKSSGY